MQNKTLAFVTLFLVSILTQSQSDSAKLAPQTKKDSPVIVKTSESVYTFKDSTAYNKGVSKSVGGTVDKRIKRIFRFLHSHKKD